MTSPTANVHTAINQVMQQVGYVQKQKGAGLGYSFAGEAALIAAIRPPMVEAGLYCSVATVRDIQRGTYTTSNGKPMNAVDLVAVIRFTHADSGTSIDVEALGSGADSGDKASNKALTGAYKYALRQTFCIETGDDPDNHPSEGRAIATRKINAATGEIAAPKPTNGGTQHKPATGLWARWDQIAQEARVLKIPVPSLDPAADDEDVMKAGKALAALIATKKKDLTHA